MKTMILFLLVVSMTSAMANTEQAPTMTTTAHGKNHLAVNLDMESTDVKVTVLGEIEEEGEQDHRLILATSFVF